MEVFGVTEALEVLGALEVLEVLEALKALEVLEALKALEVLVALVALVEEADAEEAAALGPLIKTGLLPSEGRNSMIS